MNSTSSPRLYELDWLRTGAITLVVFYHCGMFFNTWDWHIKSADPDTWLQPLMIWMHAWRMPLLLFISGVGTCFLLRKRSLKRFIWERHNRLMIPLLFGMLVIVPPQVYVERAEQFSSYWSFYPTVFNFVPYPMGGSFSWHHLWFICYLFFFSLVCLPLFAWFRSERSARLRAGLANVLNRPGRFGWFLVTLILADLWLRQDFPHNTGAFIDDWANFTHYCLFFVGGYLAMTLPGLWDTLKRDRARYSVLALLSGGLLLAMYFRLIPGFHFRNHDVIWTTLKSATGWFTILALVGWAQVLLRRKSARLQRWNEASYPVYILHQTLIIMVALPIQSLGLPHPAAFGLMFTIGLVGSYAIHYYVIQHFSVLRVLFGLKVGAARNPSSVDRDQSPKNALPLAESHTA